MAKNRGATSKDEPAVETSNESNDKSLFPITDSGCPVAKQEHRGFLNERDLQRTVIHSATNTSQKGQTNRAGTLGSIPPQYIVTEPWVGYRLCDPENPVYPAA